MTCRDYGAYTLEIFNSTSAAMGKWMNEWQTIARDSMKQGNLVSRLCELSVQDDCGIVFGAKIVDFMN